MMGLQTNYRAWTNYYLTHIGLTNGLDEYGEPATGRVETIEVCYFADDGTMDVWAWAFQDNTISNVMVDFSEYVVTNIMLHTEDLWSWDSYEAWRKRYREYSGGPASALPWYYRDPEENLTAIKSSVKAAMGTDPYYIGLRWYPSSATNNPLGDTNAPSVYTLSNLMVDAAIPTNWFDVTFHRDLSGAMQGEGHEVTSVYTIIATNGNVVTNNWLDYTNGVHEAIGTNGMQFTHDCINPQVPEGYTTADYGYKHVPKLLSLLDTLGTVSGQLPPRYSPVMTAGPYRYAVGTNYTLAASSWAATTNVELAFPIPYEVMFGRPSTAVYEARRARPRSVLTTKAPEFNRKSVVHYSFGPTAWIPGTNIFADLDSVLPVGATPGWYTFGELAYSTNAVLTNLTFVVSGSDAFPGVGYGGIATNRYYGISASDTLWLMKYDWDSPK